MSDQAGILPKWFSNQGIILPKGQLDHSYTFWTKHILIFSPAQIIMGHPLVLALIFCKIDYGMHHLGTQYNKVELQIIYQTLAQNSIGNIGWPLDTSILSLPTKSNSIPCCSQSWIIVKRFEDPFWKTCQYEVGKKAQFRLTSDHLL